VVGSGISLATVPEDRDTNIADTDEALVAGLDPDHQERDDQNHQGDVTQEVTADHQGDALTPQAPKGLTGLDLGKGAAIVKDLVLEKEAMEEVQKERRADPARDQAVLRRMIVMTMTKKVHVPQNTKVVVQIETT